MKLCKDCKWSSGGGEFSECASPKVPHTVNPVSGERRNRYKFCSVNRTGPWLFSFISRDCGPTARHFEPKPSTASATQVQP